LAKTKVAVVEDGLKHAAEAVGTAIGTIAKKVGLKRVAAAVTPKHKKKAVKKALSKSATSKKKSAPAKTVAAKRVVAKKASPKKKSPAKKK
jgi:DNA-binding protein HU-beta